MSASYAPATHWTGACQMPAAVEGYPVGGASSTRKLSRMQVHRPLSRMQRMYVWLPLALLLAVALVLLGGVGVASASSSLFAKGGEPVCTVTSTSSSSSSTTCTATLSQKNRDSRLRADVDVSGFAVFQCQTSTGSTTAGQNQVQVYANQSNTPIPLGATTFTTSPAVLNAPATVSAQAAGCPTGSTVGNPTLTTTSISFRTDNGSIMSFPCTASNPNGLSGTVPLSC